MKTFIWPGKSRRGSIGARAAPSFGEVFLFWLKLGFISFGRPTGQIAIMHAGCLFVCDLARSIPQRNRWNCAS
jgi:hypothetical protein